MNLLAQWMTFVIYSKKVAAFMTGGASTLSYQQYGISPQLVERIKLKNENPAVKDRI